VRRGEEWRGEVRRGEVWRGEERRGRVPCSGTVVLQTLPQYRRTSEQKNKLMFGADDPTPDRVPQ
jgi:hypothetical protein